MHRQAGDIVAQLKKGIALKALVVRDGKEEELEARDLVPGDIVVLEEGRTIAADAKVSMRIVERLHNHKAASAYEFTALS